ncbi:MAG: DUF2066 domain-containing protein [Gammaproteobacteria bacterium]|nr:DUF2066 domain-containing protein [Gammaproteobacteria bacterium]
MHAASEVDGLYEASVPVVTQEKEERKLAIRAAFEAVIIKVAGDRNAVALLELSGVLENLVPFIQQYRYDKLPETLVVSQTIEPQPTQLLWARFDEAEVNRILQQNNLPVWSRVRPVMLVWLAVEDAGMRFVVDSGSVSDIPAELNRLSKHRGVPVVLPLMDLEDQQNIRVTDIWGNFNEPVRLASERYQAEAILVGRLLRDRSGGWRGRWTFYGNEQSTGVHWSNIASTQPELISMGVNGASDWLAQRFSHIFSELEEDNVLLTISDVNQVEHYASVQTYLEKLPSVTQAQAVRIEADNITYQLKLKSGTEDLLQSIKLGKSLVPVETSNPITPDGQRQTPQDSPQHFIANRFFYRFVH